jgi:hypothetical protein
MSNVIIPAADTRKPRKTRLRSTGGSRTAAWIFRVRALSLSNRVAHRHREGRASTTQEGGVRARPVCFTVAPEGREPHLVTVHDPPAEAAAHLRAPRGASGLSGQNAACPREEVPSGGNRTRAGFPPSRGPAYGSCLRRWPGGLRPRDHGAVVGTEHCSAGVSRRE